MPEVKPSELPGPDYRTDADLHGGANALPANAATAFLLAQVGAVRGREGDPQEWIQRVLLRDKTPSKQ